MTKLQLQLKRNWLIQEVTSLVDTRSDRLQEIDPSGSAKRRIKKLKRRLHQSPGPNFCWHIDGYDKLKRFGFPIHGCIDGFSRKLIWLDFVD